MNEQDEPLSRGPVTLQFFGVENETTSDEDDEEEEEEEEKQNNIQTNSSDPVVLTCNGNTHNLTVNSCYGNN
jgi:hypothetical protein